MRKTKLYEIKAFDPKLGRRRSFYSSVSKEDAIEKAAVELSKGDDLKSFYSGVYLPAVASRSATYVIGIGKSMEKHVLPRFGHLAVEDISRQSVQRFFNDLGASGLRGSYVRLIKKHFSGVMRLAQIDGMIGQNPVTFVRLPDSAESEREPLTTEEAKTLLYGAGEWTNAVVLGLLGLRPGEICAASWADLKDGMIHVERQIKLNAFDKWEVSEVLKTPQSRRPVPLPKEFEPMMTKDKILIVGGNPVHLWRELKTVAARLGIEDFTTHRLRHTFVSVMENELECPRRIVAQIAGKAKKGEMDRYSKSSEERRKHWTDRYASHLSYSTTNTMAQVQ